MKVILSPGPVDTVGPLGLGPVSGYERCLTVLLRHVVSCQMTHLEGFFFCTLTSGAIRVRGSLSEVKWSYVVVEWILDHWLIRSGVKW